MKPSRLAQYRQVLAGMDELNLLMAMEDAGLMDLYRCPHGIQFVWYKRARRSLALPLQQEWMNRTSWHPLLSFLRDCKSYQPPSTVNHAG